MAEREFDELLKSVTQINARLEVTGRLINDLTQKLASFGANAPLANMVKSLESDIRRLTELKSKITYEGVSRVAGGVPPTTAQDTARQQVLRNVEVSLERYQRDLQTAIERINRPVSAGLREAANKLLYGTPTVPEDVRGQRARRIFPEAYGLPANQQEGPARTINHPTRNISTNEDFLARRAAKQFAENFNRGLQEIARAAQVQRLAESGGGNFDAFGQRITQRLREEAFRAGRLPTFDAQLRNRELGVPEVSRAADRLKAQEEKLLNTLRARISSEEKYTQALEQARRLGFGPEHLKRSLTQGTAGNERLSFERYDDSGVQRRFDTIVNPNGRATPTISNQFRSFGQGVIRDIGELTKWSIALAAVYGPMRKLQELTEIMIENQTRLAEATISVSSSFLDQSGIFNIAADSAEKAGESIGGVIDAFTQAYRATGGAGNQVERLAIAQDLLSDSLVLSKLSTLDQASAIDTLSAALRQSGSAIDKNNNPLQNGTELLDKWVRVTKVANVDLASLATGFAVLGDAAEAAQIDIDELNGLLGAIAETGVASGRELANTARAIVAGTQSDQAREALENIGVAFETTTGQARPFMEIMQELASLRSQGILDDTAFSRLTLALGGGTRRQAAFATLIESFGRVGEIAGESARAQGDAQAALAKQLDTVQTSLTRLGNAFQELAQTLGTEGGFLGIITAGVDGITALVKSFDFLTSSLGKATPALAAFIATSLILKQRGQGGIQQALFGAGAGLQRDPELLRLAQVSGSPLGAVPAQGRGRQAIQTLTGTGPIAGAVQGLLVSALPALMNAFNKEDRFGGTKAVANVIGGVSGGIVGSLVAGSPIIGAAVGTAIAEAFVNTTVARSTDIFGYGQAPSLAKDKTLGSSPEELDAALREAEVNLYKSIGFGNESVGRFLSAPVKTNEVILERLNETIKEGNKEQFEQRLNVAQKELSSLGITPELARQAFEERRQIEVSPENRAYRMASDEARRGYDEAYSARVARGDVVSAQDETEFSSLVSRNKQAFESLLTSLEERSKERLSTDRISGDIRGAEYGRRTGALSDFDVKALQYYTALGDQVDQLTDGTDNASRAFEILNNVIVFGAEDALPQITQVAGEIQEIINLLADPALNEKRLEDLGGIGGATEKLAESRQVLANLIEDANKQALLGRIKVPDIQGDIGKPVTTPELGMVQERYAQLEKGFYKDFLKLPDDMLNALKESFEPFAVPVKDFEDSVAKFEEVIEKDPKLWQEAMAQLLAEGKLKSQKTDPFDIQKLDITSQQGAGLQGSINYFSRYLAQNFPQYQQNPEDVGVIFSDYVTSVLHGDNLAIKLALEKIVDLNQKQLDGMYNIPEGATFWVPLTAAYYRPKNEGAGGLGLPDVGGEAANTQALDANTQALRELAMGFRGDLGYSRVAEENKNAALGFRGDRGYTREAEANRRAALGFRGDLGYARAAQEDRVGGGFRPPAYGGRYNPTVGGGEVILEKLYNLLRSLLAGRSPAYGGTYDPRPNVGGASRQSFLSNSNAQQVQPVVNAKLDMRIDNNTQLVVDGRVLASVITPYLASDLIRLEAAQGTITKRVII